VIPFHSAGASRYFDTGSSSPSLPSSTSVITAIAVNCFPIDPDWNTVSGFTGTRCSRFAMPYPSARTTRPCLRTMSATPGILFFAM
jgi:hypothetical protein